jgi:hypothetical protein
MDFPFFFCKNWEILQFRLGQIFCSANFRWDSPIFPKSTGLGLLIYIIGTGGQIRSENSALKVKNTKNSTKNGGNQNLRENCPISPWKNFPHFFG